MFDETETTMRSLMGSYARYFIEDFAKEVLNHLKASAPVDPIVLSSFINQSIDVKNISFDAIVTVNPVTRFIHELSVFALEKTVANPESREVYDVLKSLPSIHHEELKALAYQSAILYSNTLNNTIINVIASDAKQTAERITVAAKSRTSMVETGGNLNIFNWGILSDGLWLNGALSRSFALANIFRPNEPPVAYYATVAFDFARHYTAAPAFTSDEAVPIYGGYDVVLSNGDARVLDSVNWDMNGTTPLEVLFTPGALDNAIDSWEMGLSNPQKMIAAISELSNYATHLPHLIDVAGNLDEGLVPPLVRERMIAAYNAVTLCLAAFEALRTTKFNEALILFVLAPSDDPTVEVFVNGDVLPQFVRNGGSEADICHLGTYLDPRRGLPSSQTGWNVEWALNRRDAIVGEVIADTQERVDSLRRQDSIVIQDLVIKTLSDIVSSYADAAQLAGIPSDIKTKINEISRRVTTPLEDESFSLEKEIFDILVRLVGNPFVTSMSNNLMSLSTDARPEVCSNAYPLTMAATAVDDVCSMFDKSTLAA